MDKNYESNQIFDVTGIQKISIEKLKSLTGKNNMSDELAETIIDSLYILSIIAYEGNK
ncbi:hypothetical protein [Tenacibaculum singaporense]|uniref:hypothetical protein n=1 Tax=Tenacibaculum singaporense TaxID=2358479 RepID=UPI003516486F